MIFLSNDPKKPISDNPDWKENGVNISFSADPQKPKPDNPDWFEKGL